MSATSDLRVPGDRAGVAAPTGPSGWQTDPWHRHQSRFFDGHQWTEHVADGGVASIDSAPVADLPRSRPIPPDDAPPDGTGPRVLAQDQTSDLGLDEPLLLVDLAPDAEGVRRLRTPQDVEVGRIGAPRAATLTRLGRALVAAPGDTPTRLVVTDATGDPALRLRRPGRRLAPVVDVAGPDGALGTITATSLRQGLRARVDDAAGTEVGHLEQRGPDAALLTVVDRDDRPLARLTPVWDVPGTRHHLPPGVVLVDRRPPDDGDGPGPDRLLLAALLAPALLLPPGRPPE